MLAATLKLEIEKLRRQLFGTRSERTARLLEQYELQLEELEAVATEDELAAEQAASRATAVKAFTLHIKAFSSLNLPKHRSPINGFLHILSAVAAYQIDPIEKMTDDQFYFFKAIST